jgi:hypothetical protein
MSKAARTIDFGRMAASAADNDVIHFLQRTLQAHTLDAAPQDVLTKLQNLKSALDRQECTLSDWPDSPSKDRICTALAKARKLVARIVDEFEASAETHRSDLDAKAV